MDATFGGWSGFRDVVNPDFARNGGTDDSGRTPVGISDLSLRFAICVAGAKCCCSTSQSIFHVKPLLDELTRISGEEARSRRPSWKRNAAMKMSDRCVQLSHLVEHALGRVWRSLVWPFHDIVA
jgi:hypothetical protein